MHLKSQFSEQVQYTPQSCGSASEQYNK